MPLKSLETNTSSTDGSFKVENGKLVIDGDCYLEEEAIKAMLRFLDDIGFLDEMAEIAAGNG